MREKLNHIKSLVDRLSHLGRNQQGASAIEFAIIAPVFLTIFVATLDIGSALYTRFELNQAISAAAAHAIANASSVNGDLGENLATQMATLVSGTTSTAEIIVNNGPAATYDGEKIKLDVHHSKQADRCYCPKGSALDLNWGRSMTCGDTCSDGSGRAGKFVAIAARRKHTPLFSGYGFIDAGTITVGAVVRAE